MNSQPAESRDQSWLCLSSLSAHTFQLLFQRYQRAGNRRDMASKVVSEHYWPYGVICSYNGFFSHWVLLWVSQRSSSWELTCRFLDSGVASLPTGSWLHCSPLWSHIREAQVLSFLSLWDTSQPESNATLCSANSETPGASSLGGSFVATTFLSWDQWLAQRISTMSSRAVLSSRPFPAQVHTWQGAPSTWSRCWWEMIPLFTIEYFQPLESLSTD